MSLLRIRIDGSKTWFLPGGELQGDVSWHLDREAETAEIRLFWYTQGKGTRDVAVVDSVRVVRPRESDHRRFRFVLPEGPYSFSGKLITLAWAVELVLLPGDETERVDLLVGPRPVEVSLQGVRQ